MRWVVLFGATALTVLQAGQVQAQDRSSSALMQICDQAAASPLDDRRPSGVSGVDAEKVDPKVAVPACEAAAKAAPTDPRVAFQLGRAYLAAKAYESALAVFEKADGLGYVLAANNLAAMYSRGLGVPVDKAHAVVLLQKAAEGGIPLAMYNLAVNYRDGTGIANDLTQARRWFAKAAERRDPDGMNDLGAMLHNGQGGPKNLVEARQWFERSARAGNGKAMNNLGAMLYLGDGGPRDLAQARHWYEKSAMAGTVEAMNIFGKMLDNGEGGPKDLAAARLWYGKAAEGGNSDAMSNFGWALENGHGGPRDMTEARKWYRKAADGGSAWAKQKLAALDAPVSSARRREAGSGRGARRGSRNPWDHAWWYDPNISSGGSSYQVPQPQRKYYPFGSSNIPAGVFRDGAGGWQCTGFCP